LSFVDEPDRSKWYTTSEFIDVVEGDQVWGFNNMDTIISIVNVIKNVGGMHNARITYFSNDSVGIGRWMVDVTSRSLLKFLGYRKEKNDLTEFKF